MANIGPSVFEYCGHHKVQNTSLLFQVSASRRRLAVIFVTLFFDNAMWLKGIFVLSQAALLVIPTNAATQGQGALCNGEIL
jgi:hypothetical protein